MQLWTIVALALTLVGPLPARDTWREHRVEHGGVGVRFVDAGPRAAEAILLVHGFWDSVEITWASTGVLDELAGDRRVLALDCRGHGASDKPHDPASYGTAMVDDLARVLEAAGVERAHLIGHSMGAHLVLRFALERPDRVLSLTLLGAGAAPALGDPGLMPQAAASLESGPTLGPLLERIWPEGAARPSADAIRAIDADAFATNDPLALAGVARSYGALTVTDEEASRIRVPVMAVVGSLDPMRRDAERLARALPDMRVLQVEGADHIDIVERPEALEAMRRNAGPHGGAKGRAGVSTRCGLGTVETWRDAATVTAVSPIIGRWSVPGPRSGF